MGDKKKPTTAYSPLMGKPENENRRDKPDGITCLRLTIDPMKGTSSLEPDHGFWGGMDSVQKALRTAKKKRAREQNLKREEKRRKRNVRSRQRI